MCWGVLHDNRCCYTVSDDAQSATSPARSIFLAGEYLHQGLRCKREPTPAALARLARFLSAFGLLVACWIAIPSWQGACVSLLPEHCRTASSIELRK